MVDKGPDREITEPTVLADVRVGDVLRVVCEPVHARVSSDSPYYVFVRWPWGEVDPDSRFRWNGERAFPRRADHCEWDMELFRLEPEPAGLAVGDVCLVGIPETTVHVLSVEHFQPPQDRGWLPRPTRSLYVMRRGQSFDPELEDQGCVLYPGGHEPMELELLFRPYAFLEIGDEIVDARGDAWRFEHPWNWYSFSGQTGRPRWPLTLLARRGQPVEAKTVVAETVSGSHEAEEARWRSMTGAEPVMP
ncbi:hypothetical protein QFZ82_007478 [Streptomyces sp. V4I23]|uniref:hypothetical protein n=1 Tax=Streptomyces sp. V4I23 TaxID=3042282 RepID=UPI00277DCF5B|nr:hypothetical protein [Streptomyces sp. V4I23]MDQ1012993.1 hypothetical protein [Streptomyces sp. V4I23]